MNTILMINTTTVQECGWETDYWLRHCEGFRVFTQDGRVGFVDAVELTAAGDAAALAVRFGEVFTHDVIVPAEAVSELHPESERITMGPLGAQREDADRQLRIPVAV